jgi:hypothetical protein
MEGGGSSSKEGVVPLLCTRLYCVFLFRSAACLVSELRQDTRDFWIWEYLAWCPKRYELSAGLVQTRQLCLASLTQRKAGQNSILGARVCLAHETEISRSFHGRLPWPIKPHSQSGLYRRPKKVSSLPGERNFMSKPANTSASLPRPVC